MNMNVIIVIKASMYVIGILGGFYCGLSINDV